MGRRSSNIPRGTVLLLSAAIAASAHAADDAYPSVRPATRAQAAIVLGGGIERPGGCLSPILDSHAQDPRNLPPAKRRAMSLVRATTRLGGETGIRFPDGSVVRFTTDPREFERIDPEDADRDGIPDAVSAAALGLEEARAVLVGELGFPDPGPVDLMIVRGDRAALGYVVPSVSGSARSRIVVQTPSPADPLRLRELAAHQLVHVAAARASGAEPAWIEAFASWAVAYLAGAPNEWTLQQISRRLTRMHDGFDSPTIEDAVGNSILFHFVEHAYGAAGVRPLLEELGRRPVLREALDAGFRRAAGIGVDDALRDFQLWTLLRGDRSNGRHFRFAELLASPEFPRGGEGLPALAPRGRPDIRSLGQSQAGIRPDTDRGGATVRFDGDLAGAWSVDAILVGSDGSLQRARVPVDDDGQGTLTVPLAGLAEIVLLVRNLDPGPEPRGYGWSAEWERGYPFELLRLAGEPAPAGLAGAVISWDTRGERNLHGYNIVRIAPDGTSEAINPVWIPAVGAEGEETSYQYLDGGALRGVSYVYRIEAITTDGLTTLSRPTRLRLPVAD